MKKDIIVLVLIMAAVAVALSLQSDIHQCTDNTHQLCDGGCECDGLGCN